MLVRYYGPVGIHSGYGHAANETCMAILAAGMRLEVQTYNPAPGSDLRNYLHARYSALAPCIRDDSAPSTPDPDVVIVHTLPRDCARVLEVARIRELYPQARCVAYTTWECAPPLPVETSTTLALFDEIWVPSTQTQYAIWATNERHRVHVVPHAFDESVEPTPPDHASLGPCRPFRFYYVGAWNRRKNPAGVIQAYLRVFALGDEVELVIHATDASDDACLLATVAATGKPPKEVAPIRLSNKRLSDAEIQNLHRTSHCFVTASRGEAWNLPAFDAMLARRHIISPRALGSTDFLGDTTAWLYDTALVPAGGEARLVQLPDGQVGVRSIGTDVTVHNDWWEPDINELGQNMYRAFTTHRAELHVDYDPAERFGRRAVGMLIKRLLEGATR